MRKPILFSKELINSLMGWCIMITKYKKMSLILCVAAALLGLRWYDGELNDEAKKIEFEIIVDKMDAVDVQASLFYENYFDKAFKGYETYLWKNKMMIKSSEDYFPMNGVSHSIYPQSALGKLEKQLKLADISYDVNQAFIYHSNTSDYDLFIFRDYETHNWSVFFLYDDDMKMLKINHDKSTDITGCQFDNDAVYICSDKVYIIDTKEFSVLEETIPWDEPFNAGSHIQNDLAVVQNGMIYQALLESNNVWFYKYKFNTDDFETFSIVDDQIVEIEKLLSFKDGFIMLCTEVDTFKPVLKYYDSDFTLVNQEYIKIESKHNNVTAHNDGRYFFMHDSKLYGKMHVDGKYIYEIVIVDADSADLLYQAEHSHKKGRIIMTDMRFQFLQNDKMIFMN